MDKAMHSEFEGHTPGKRCKMNGEEIYICHTIEGSAALDYEGKCYGCGAKLAITFDEENQTEYDAARAYLIKEGLDPDQLVKEGLVFIKTVQENQSLRSELQKQKELNAELLKGLEELNSYAPDFPEYPNTLSAFDMGLKSASKKAESLIKKSKES